MSHFYACCSWTPTTSYGDDAGDGAEPASRVAVVWDSFAVAAAAAAAADTVDTVKMLVWMLPNAAAVADAMNQLHQHRHLANSDCDLQALERLNSILLLRRNRGYCVRIVGDAPTFQQERCLG